MIWLDRKFHLRVITILLLVGGLFGLALGSNVRAAPATRPLLQIEQTSTLTESPTTNPTSNDTPTGSPTATETPTLTPSLTNTPTPTGTPTFTPTVTSTGTPPTATPSAPNHIVISEFRTIGPLGANDEFVELYNPTGAAVNIGGWLINKSSACGTSVQTILTITSGTILLAGQHYLVASTNNSLVAPNLPDQTFSSNIADNGGLALVHSGLSIDQVGMCDATFYHEGTFLEPLPIAPLPGTPTPAPGTSNQSYERKPGFNTACYDTNNNAVDFALISPAYPQNHDTAQVVCAGVVLTTPVPTLTRTPTPTRTLTRTPTAVPAVMVMNEILPHPKSDWNGDGITNVGDEFIEIINLNYTELSTTGWKLDTGNNSITTFSLPDMVLQPRQIAVFFGADTGISLKDGGSTVRLLRPDGRIVDAFTYPLVELPDRTWCRLPDGRSWGFICRPSPGQPNVSVNNPLPTASFVSGGNSNCPQVNTAPEALILAECDNSGLGISSNQEERSFWLKGRWKWDVFLE